MEGRRNRREERRDKRIKKKVKNTYARISKVKIGWG